MRSRAEELLEELQRYQDEVLRSNEKLLAPGVFGVTAPDIDGGLVIVWLRAEREGNGDVGRYLDRAILTGTVRVIDPNDRLSGMLDRRGFKKCQIWGADASRTYPGMVKRFERAIPQVEVEG
jgi:hypothetical protein